MRILFDQGTPVPLRRFLAAHVVATAYEQGGSTLKNGELIRETERVGFDVPVTTDKNFKYQQKVEGRAIGIVVLLTTS